MICISNHKELIDQLGGSSAVSRNIPDCKVGRVGHWKMLNRIPPEYWAYCIQMAKDRDIEGVDADRMLALP